MLRQAAQLFKALADDSRVRILEILSEGPLSVGDVAKRVGLSQPTVSHHLAVLRACRCVRDEKKGKQVFYRLNHQCVLDGFRNYLARLGVRLGRS